MGRSATMVFLGFLAAATVFPQEQVPANVEYPTAVGFAVGQISGNGLSLRHWFGPKVGIQIAAGGLYVPTSPDTGPFFSLRVLDYWSGAEVLWSLYATEFARWLFGQVYLFGGVGHFGYIPWNDILGTITPPEGEPYEGIEGYERGAYVPGFAVGGGLGIEVTLFRHFSTAFELGYAVFWEGVAGGFGQQLRVNIVPQGILQFRY